MMRTPIHRSLALQASFTTAYFAVLISGCSRPAEQPPGVANGGVAVIDLDRVAQQLGADQKMTQSISQQQQSLNAKLAKLAQAYQAQFAKQRATVAEQPEPQQGVQLASWQQQANANIAQAKSQAASELVRHRAELVQQFRAAVKPTARAVAQQRGLALIVTKNDSVVFDYVDAIDVTDAVVARLRDSTTR